MPNSSARNQFLLDCANAEIAPSMAAAELRTTSGTLRLGYERKGGGYIGVSWSYSPSLKEYFRADSIKNNECLVFDRKGMIVKRLPIVETA